MYKGLRVKLASVDGAYSSFLGIVLTNPTNGWCLVYWDDLGRTDSVDVATLESLEPMAADFSFDDVRANRALDRLWKEIDNA